MRKYVKNNIAKGGVNQIFHLPGCGFTRKKKVPDISKSESLGAVNQ